tara:strand:- start:282 stop:491 length:210 start_codon:yes stop_codon:yes gene_type:complete
MKKKYKIFVILLYLLISKEAFAYLDPGTGSFILQSIIGGLAAAGAFISIYWSKLKDIFKKLLNSSKRKK